MIYSTFTKRPRDLLRILRDGKLRYPSFRREYSWSRKRILDFVETMYRRIVMPSALVLFEELVPKDPASRKRTPQGNGVYDVIDGSQRLETLHRIAEGTLEIMFNPFEKRFQFANSRNSTDRHWLSLTKLTAMEYCKIPHVSSTIPGGFEVTLSITDAHHIFDYEFPCIHVLGYDYKKAEQTFMVCNRLNMKRRVDIRLS